MEQRRAFTDIQGVARTHVFTMGSLESKDDLLWEMDINPCACILGG
jgi:hypothetical protein